MARVQLISLVFVVLSVFPESATTYKILVYNSKFSHSHSNFLGRIADTLTEAGHNVTTLIPIMDVSLHDGTVKSRVIHVQPVPQVAAYYANPREVNFFEMNVFNPIVPFFVGPMFANLFIRTCQNVLDEPGLIERLRAEQFDVYISENFDVCGIGLSKAINPKAVIGSTSTCLWGWHFDEFGVESALSYRPSLVSSTFDPRSLLSRFWNLVGEYLARLTWSYIRRDINLLLKQRFGADYPSTWEQSANVAYVLTNSETLIESPGPTLPRVIDIPGIGAALPKPLDEYWEEIVNRRPKTVIFSFGTIVNSTQLPDGSKKGIMKAIAQFPDVTFIWKYENFEDDFCKNQASKLDNLVLTKWMPQGDLLNHPNVVAFITHGGMGSTQETAFRGVPGVFIPIFGDQHRNAGMMRFNGLGVVYDKFELHDGVKLARAIRDVLENRKYKENAERLSKMLASKPFTSRDLLIKHVEFAAEFGASAALRPQSVDMTVIEYYNLDIAATICLITVSILALLLKLALSVVTFVSVKKHKIESLQTEMNILCSSLVLLVAIGAVSAKPATTRSGKEACAEFLRVVNQINKSYPPINFAAEFTVEDWRKTCKKIVNRALKPGEYLSERALREEDKMALLLILLEYFFEQVAKSKKRAT